MRSTILIVDDEYSGRQTLESILEADGYQIEMAENGMQALEMVKIIQPDVILLDVMMPGMTGFEVCQRIRNDPLPVGCLQIDLVDLHLGHGHRSGGPAHDRVSHHRSRGRDRDMHIQIQVPSDERRPGPAGKPDRCHHADNL